MEKNACKIFEVRVACASDKAASSARARESARGFAARASNILRSSSRREAARSLRERLLRRLFTGMKIDSSATTVTSMRASRRALCYGNGWEVVGEGRVFRSYHVIPKTALNTFEKYSFCFMT